MSLKWDLSDVFLMSRLGRSFRRKTTEVKGHVHSNNSKGICSQDALSLLVLTLNTWLIKVNYLEFFYVDDVPLPQLKLYYQQSSKFWLSSLQTSDGGMGSARGERAPSVCQALGHIFHFTGG